MFRPIKIRHYVSFMESRGYKAADVLTDSGLDVEQLKNPGLLIEFAPYQAVIANMMRLTGNQGIGFEVGSESELTDFGIVGHAMMSSKTARDALALWLRYSNSLVGTLIKLQLSDHDDGRWSLTISELQPMGFVYNFGVEEILMIAVKMGAALTKTEFTPGLIELSYPAPAHQDLYWQFLKCRPQFNSRLSRVRFDTPRLSQPVRGSDEEFNAICLQHCSQIMRQIAVDSPIASRIRSLLLGKADGIPDMEVVAEKLGLSTRSLRRRLQEEGHTYKSLINRFRIELAQEYLGNSRMTAKETAYLLGFKDTNAFRRAFKAWTGQTIHEFRDEMDAGQ